ncbi:T-lymphocyte surface antigen Ly-9-like [Leuresthes tenuis]|uniref:T-lymphocyte surface antigen Ly-9-like n=1 Tax=Leuresthes tenuis TaxID=355514 RepID=UPI003B509CFB
METRLIFISLCLGTILSAAEEVKENLTGVVGGSITLPDPLLERGFLLYGPEIIASVRNKVFQIEEETYLNKLLWDTETGFFTITDLQRNNSGVYRFDSKKGRSLKSSYQLTVYDSVPPPAVKALSVSSDGCSLLCSVDREATLLWFKGEQILNQSSSASSLPLTVNTEDLRSSYRCVAANPAENKTLTVDVRTKCGLNSTESEAENKIRHCNSC